MKIFWGLQMRWRLRLRLMMILLWSICYILGVGSGGFTDEMWKARIENLRKSLRSPGKNDILYLRSLQVKDQLPT